MSDPGSPNRPISGPGSPNPVLSGPGSSIPVASDPGLPNPEESEPTTEPGSEFALPGEGSDTDLNFHSTGQIGGIEDVGSGDFGAAGIQSTDNLERRRSKYSAASNLRMAKHYGLFSSVAVIICNVIGSGIFINPQDVFKKTESTGISLLIWLGLGIHVTMGALCYSELGTTLPLSGGDYAYLQESFGSFAGFEFQFCSNLLFIPAVNAILAYTVGNYLLKLICIYECIPQARSEMMTIISNGSVCPVEMMSKEKVLTPMDILYDSNQELYATLIGSALIVGITALNCLFGRASEIMQNGFTVAKLSACLMVILLGIVQLTTGKFQSSIEIKLNEDYGAAKHAFDISAGVYEVSFSYLGWTYLNFLTEELENPYRNLPIAIIVSMPLITLIYMLMNVSYFAILDTVSLCTTGGIASDSLNAVLGKGLAKELGWIAPVIVMISAFGGLTSHMNGASRVSFVGARAGQLPRMFFQIHTTRLTPIPALLLQGIMSIIYMIIQRVVLVIVMSVYCETFFSSLAVVALLYLRFTKPNLPRPIKLFIGIPIFYTFISVLLFLIPIVGIFVDTKDLASSLPVVLVPIGIFLLGIPAYFYFISHPPAFDNLPEWFYSPNCQTRVNHCMESWTENNLNLKRGE